MCARRMSRALSKNSMEKERIIAAFDAASKAEKDAITEAARKYLAAKKIKVGRSALAYWRKNDMKRSPIAKHYQTAYEKAITAAKNE